MGTNFLAALAFHIELEDHNANVKRLNDDKRSIFGRNLVSCRPVTPEFTKLEYVQQASISTRVSFATFARPGELDAKLCHAFLAVQCMDLAAVFAGFRDKHQTAAHKT